MSKPWWKDSNLPHLNCRKCGNHNAIPTGENRQFGAECISKDKIWCPDCKHVWWSTKLVPARFALADGRKEGE